MSQDTINIIISVIVVLVLCLFGFILFAYSMARKQGSRLSYKKKAKQVPVGRYLRSFNRYVRNPLTRNAILKLHKRISRLSVYTFIESKIQSVKIFNNGLLMFSILLTIAILLFKDVTYVIITSIVIVVMREQFFHKSIDKVYRKLLEEELQMLSSLRQEYARTRSVVEAFEAVETGPHIQRAVKEIHDALSSIDVEEKLEAFASSTPLPTLQTLASIAYITDNRGDAKTDQGESTFAKAIDMVSDEVRMAIRKEYLQKQLFGAIEFIPIVPIFAVAPLSAIFKYLIPGTAYIYDGAIGFVFTIIILTTSLIGYYMVTNINRTATISSDDRSLFDKKLMSIPIIRDHIRKVLPRRHKTVMKKQELLKASLTRLTLDYLYLRKIYLSIGMFFAMLMLLAVYLTTGKASVLSNVSGSSMVGVTNISKEEQEMLEILDEKFLHEFLQMPTRSEVEEFIKVEMPFVASYNIEDQAIRLERKYQDYYNMHLYWWHLWLCFFAAMYAYNAPDKILKTRAKIVAAESEEDCLQLQTSIAILMNTSADTLEMLEHLYKNSRIFKSILIDCYLSYTADAEKALRTAKLKTKLPEFRNMMDKLSLTITQITLKEAFSDLASERSHMLRMRESFQIHALESKRVIVKPFVMAPLASLILCQFIAPICILAFSMFTDFMSSGLLTF